MDTTDKVQILEKRFKNVNVEISHMLPDGLLITRIHHSDGSVSVIRSWESHEEIQANIASSVDDWVDSGEPR